MKTLFNESRNGTAARATEFCDLAAAIQFMKEKQKQHPHAEKIKKIEKSQWEK